jgi:hypothetical protein
MNRIDNCFGLEKFPALEQLLLMPLPEYLMQQFCDYTYSTILLLCWLFAKKEGMKF